MKNILQSLLASCLLAITLVSLLLTTSRAQAQSLTVLYAFKGGSDGSKPAAGLVRDAAGNLYGTTPYGGASGFGTVFKVDSAGNETVLYSFTGQPDGDMPFAALVRDAAGNLYGTTFGGGNFHHGTVFKIDTAGNETVLHSFRAQPDGESPVGLIRDTAGNLYGTTVLGGDFNSGIVFKLDAAGNYSVLYNFTGGADGWYPEGRLLQDAAGNLYGTTVGGGDFAGGTVFRLDAAGNETVLYSFTFGREGGSPGEGLIRDAVGNLYSTTYNGGGIGIGVVFKLKLNTNRTHGVVSVIHTFRGLDGAFPKGGLIWDGQGNIYGTTEGGGDFRCCGTIFKLDGAGTETVLYSFSGGNDGSGPSGGLIRDAAGNLYGTTSGVFSGYGTVFKLAP